MTFNESITDCIAFNVPYCHSSLSFYLKIRVLHVTIRLHPKIHPKTHHGHHRFHLSDRQRTEVTSREFENRNLPNDGTPAPGLYSIVPPGGDVEDFEHLMEATSEVLGVLTRNMSKSYLSTV